MGFISESRAIYGDMSEQAKYYTRVGFLSTALLITSGICLGKGTGDRDLSGGVMGGIGFGAGAIGLIYAGVGRCKEEGKELRNAIYGAEGSN
mgnify:FL=1|jgi:hypothetical protein